MQVRTALLGGGGGGGRKRSAKMLSPRKTGDREEGSDREELESSVLLQVRSKCR